MNVGCNVLYPYGNLEKSSQFSVQATQEALCRLKEIGYDAVEYSHAFHFTRQDADAVRAYGEGIGIGAWSLHAEGPQSFRPGDSPDEAQRNLIHCVEICAALGGRVVVGHFPYHLGLQLGEDPDLQAFLDSDRRVLEPVIARALALGVDLALENGRDLAHMHYILELQAAIAAPNLGFCVDTGHAHLGDLGAPQAIRMAGSKLYTTHLQDNRGERDDHLPPGMGAIAWDAVFEALRDVGYARTLMLELTDKAGPRPYDQAKETRHGESFTRRLAERHLLPRPSAS